VPFEKKVSLAKMLYYRDLKLAAVLWAAIPLSLGRPVGRHLHVIEIGEKIENFKQPDQFCLKTSSLQSVLQTIGVWRGVSKGVENSRRPPNLRVGYPACGWAVS
jgi:hypothetical protein